MQRVCIIGTSASGKTTLGRNLAARLGGRSVDLDEYFWEPGWTGVPDEVFISRLTVALHTPCWVTSGNYTRIRDIYVSQADTIIWLDYSFPVVLLRVLIRTYRRAVLGESCCNGNYESLRRTLSRESIVLWVFKTYRKNRRKYEAFFADPPYAHLQLIRHRSPRETNLWLESLEMPDSK